MSGGAMLLLVVVLTAVVIYGAYQYYERTRPKTYCPKCGGELTGDGTKYRYTVEWTCQECGEIFEQLRNKN